MASGILNTLGSAAVPILSGIIAKASLPNPDPSIYPDAAVWRPPNWNQRAQYVITVPVSSQPTPSVGTSVVSDGLGGNLAGAPAYQSPILYVFDATLVARHNRRIRLTEYPVQTEAPISDHAFQLPASLTLEIGMSDAMDSYYANSWTGSASKSVSAYQTMKSLLQSRVFVNIATRLDSYTNMILEDIDAPENAKTTFGLRATLRFREVFVATVTAVSSGVVSYGDSARPQTTSASPSGTVQLANPSPTVISQNQVPTSTAAQYPTVLGAGNWSSSSIGNLSSALG